MFDALEKGDLKAIWIMGTNPLVSLPDVRRAEAALAKAPFVVVQEVSSKPETLHYADLILPAAAWAEKEGTMTNAERRITYLSKVTDAPGEARGMWRFFVILPKGWIIMVLILKTVKKCF
ncbi:molybdopterin-dependent oxidoreductase [Arachidicoccus ginsenosidivorans]|uniref:molybdopterin-dependent oxidoreductase n=1 Tax=Arachidicoccus ginsenosidivorans TaxID=496057 RepID=UPI0021D08C08|nr:molybdopterin-dependent oxidoreductase [Arachidicoccus ginsenosidivorans]